jgi:hypothetical protein
MVQTGGLSHDLLDLSDFDQVALTACSQGRELVPQGEGYTIGLADT